VLLSQHTKCIVMHITMYHMADTWPTFLSVLASVIENQTQNSPFLYGQCTGCRISSSFIYFFGWPRYELIDQWMLNVPDKWIKFNEQLNMLCFAISRLTVVSREAKKGQSDRQKQNACATNYCVSFTRANVFVIWRQLLNPHWRHKTFLPTLTTTPKIKEIG